MRKKIFVTLLLTTVVFALLFTFLNRNTGTDEEKAEAIRQAQEYSTSEICLTVMTPATHVETGAKFTFNSSCIAPGWKSNL